ncbi:uncharacterized protein F4822DRAFT_430047 [Hypoxylon trugodes]|uniref:uncharacterized protein n=1 Tax=Hypoxylon trugodes TaxID=326681 RepID=UPI00219C08D6|nr:uncharacterized protein F4822DRAFT_430047 [Hypoxylon trugodes]KAI1387293.1 hypothetical protein F4822DRAFT_430047 [Hypoxylon trugodes]
MEEKLYPEAIGPRSPLVFIFKEFGAADHLLRLECLSELLATLQQLNVYGISVDKYAPLPWLAWRRLREDRCINSLWMFKTLQCMLQIPEDIILAINPLLGETSSTTLQRFHSWIKRVRVSGLTGDDLTVRADFIPDIEVQILFRDGSLLDSILELIMRTARMNIKRKAIRETCGKVMCILLLLRRWDLLPIFVSNPELHDSNLPFLANPGWAPFDDFALWRRFDQVQWRFCVRALGFLHECASSILRETSRSPQEILPIKSTNYLGGYDFVVVDRPRCVRIENFKSSNAKEYYEAELRALNRLSAERFATEEIVAHFGGVRFGNTFCLLLENTEMGDLGSYMKNNTPPTSENEMRHLWKRIFQLGSALLYIHRIPYRDLNGSSVFGWLRNIRPGIIMVTGSFDPSIYGVTFKFADLGFSHFRSIKPKAEDILDWDSARTRIYESPEDASSRPTTNVKDTELGQAGDLWSLGCVYSEVATWSVFGYQILERYRRSREKQTIDIEGICSVGCFHDGRCVLSSVKASHSAVKKEVEYGTLHMVIPVIYDMLLTDIHLRSFGVPSRLEEVPFEVVYMLLR